MASFEAVRRRRSSKPFGAKLALAAATLISLSTTSSLLGASPAFAQSTNRPNVLIIVTDDQRATGTMQVMPATRRLFQKGGVRYPNAFAVTPLCCPSRATILTGRYAHNTGVWGNGPVVRRFDRTTMFARLLKRSGYRSAMVGKLLNSWPLEKPPPYFDRWASGGMKYTDAEFNVNGTVKTVPGYATNVVGDFARRFLRLFEADDDAPWLLYVAPHAPHDPWTAAARHRSASVGIWPGNPAVSEADRSDKPAYVRRFGYSLAGGRAVRDGQLRALMSVDDMVGRLFATLRNLGEKRRTLAIFTSDNGYLWADHGLGGDRSTAGNKRVPYTASVQIPFMLRWPGHIAAGKRDGRLTGTVDIAPTVLAAARVAPDPAQPPLDGRSVLTEETRPRILLEFRRDRSIPTWASIRTTRYQYVEYYKDGRRFFREYYNLVRDPWQLRNLLRDGKRANDPDVGRLSRRLRHDRRCAGTLGRRACP
jgi:arylsulfatase A-like enzyme